MRRRVELAKGLLNHPDVLLLDEPSTGLDPAARIDLWRALADVRTAGVTVLVTTHLMDEADRCDRLAVLAAGKLLACDAAGRAEGADRRRRDHGPVPRPGPAASRACGTGSALRPSGWTTPCGSSGRGAASSSPG